MKTSLARFAFLAFVVGILAGCGDGGGGGGGGNAPPVVTPPPGATLPPAPVPPGNAPVNVANLTPEQFAALEPQVVFGGAIVSSPPQVSFAIQDKFGNPIVGWGGKSTLATSPTGSRYNNLAFAIAKVIPGAAATGGGMTPSRWVSYMVVSTSKNADTGALTNSAGRPGTENVGTLVDNGNGTYKYTFYRDITKVVDDINAITPAVSDTNKAALGGDTAMADLTFDANAVHRLTIQVSGNAPGTSTNTPDGSNSGVAGVPLEAPVDAIYDFIPATGKTAESGRDIVATAKCEECHRKLGGIPGDSSAASPALFHGGARNETRYCVVCHTEQRKYGRTEATIDANLTFTSSTTLVDGRAIGNLPNYIHKTHLGPILAKKNYDYAGVKFNEVHFPQDIRNCTKCHDGSDTSTAKTAQGNNWMNVPSRLACGACHDGINFATGKGVTLADAAKGLTTSQFGHIGGAQASDTNCTLCHGAAAIDVYHIPVTPPNPHNSLVERLSNENPPGAGSSNTNAAWIASNTSRLPEGAIKVSYEIVKVSRNASQQPVMEFKVLLQAPGAATPTAATFNDPATSTEMLPNFMGSPSAYFVFAVPQDGNATPADFNGTASGYLRNIWNKTATGTGAGTLTGPVNGVYTVTLTGVKIPDSATMLTGGLGYSYNVRSTLPLTQTNLVDYPVTTSPIGQPNKPGGLIVIASNKQKVADGYTGRRAIVEDARCNKCHQELGTFTEEAFHGGQRNDGTTCSWCHTPNRASSGWSADSTAFVHAIHGSSKRTVKYNWHAVSATEGFWQIHYPGVLNDCETCHLPGGYDYSLNNANPPNKRQYRLTASGTISANDSTSPYVTTGLNYGSNFSFNAGTGAITDAAGTTLVTSPIAAVCSACHDSDLAISHMKSNGGSFYAARSAALTTGEQCTLCHIAGKVADIKAVHAK